MSLLAIQVIRKGTKCCHPNYKIFVTMMLLLLKLTLSNQSIFPYLQGETSVNVENLDLTFPDDFLSSRAPVPQPIVTLNFLMTFYLVKHQ